jgi:hypothetical protein
VRREVLESPTRANALIKVLTKPGLVYEHK